MNKIKVIIIKIWKLIMNCIYFFFKKQKTRNKITFISRQSNNTSIDFQLIINEIKKIDNNIEIVVLNKKLNKNIFEMISYFFHMFVQMHHIATSKVVILDGYCILISILKHKENLRVIQIWHALGALKKFGYSILDEKEGSSRKLAEVMNMHQNYTYVLTSSENTKKYFAEAFNVSEEKMKVIPLPRVDFLLSSEYKENVTQKFYNIYSELEKSKKSILYVPTFRKNIKSDDFSKITDVIDFSKYNLIIKTHDDTELVYVDKDKYYSKKTGITGLELLHVADYIITDYSAITYEAAVINKPIYFYNYDYDDYKVNRGFYINYQDEMPGLISKDILNIIQEIEKDNFDYERLKKFKEKYIETKYNNKNTECLVNLILEVFGEK